MSNFTNCAGHLLQLGQLNLRSQGH